MGKLKDLFPHFKCQNERGCHGCCVKTIDNHDLTICQILKKHAVLRDNIFIEFLKMYPMPDTLLDINKFNDEYVEDAIYVYKLFSEYAFPIYLYHVYCQTQKASSCTMADRKLMVDILQGTVDESSLQKRFEENGRQMDEKLEVTFEITEGYSEIMGLIKIMTTIIGNNSSNEEIQSICNETIVKIENDLSKESRHIYNHKACWPKLAAVRHVYGRMVE